METTRLQAVAAVPDTWAGEIRRVKKLLLHAPDCSIHGARTELA
jgi:hypothetical protein